MLMGFSAGKNSRKSVKFMWFFFSYSHISITFSTIVSSSYDCQLFIRPMVSLISLTSLISVGSLGSFKSLSCCAEGCDSIRPYCSSFRRDLKSEVHLPILSFTI